ncbi:histidine kinase [Prauserella sp. PE36]|uniref:histidine kinase n=1 Tax=Prauserella endophytica TaxID=1592324 RepID=A0ABY2S3L7_9PSEU|nr:MULTISPECIES: GAF domain-containing protein [Prauserella]PXY34372.1 histidine kinase [Prauserella coralliicola]RBM23135.1 histidine kinase [Prauserella sp. PE36]TKG69937.1 GAF domain-containing protein [Prauserella endophytica]
MAAEQRNARERVVEQSNALDGLLRERDGLLTVLDRVVALHGTARLIRERLGADFGFVADLDGPDQAVIRWLAGNRTDQLHNLIVPVGQGIGGRVLALGQPVRVSDYVSSPTITHQFDAQVRGEGLGGMLAVPIISRFGDKEKTVAVAYAAMRKAADFGDAAVLKLEGIADRAATALHLAGLAESSTADAVTAERQRMQSALHDSVGALLFSIGVQVRDLHEAIRDNPALDVRLQRLESDVSAASSALRESLLALADTTPERALPVELAEYTRSFEARTGVPARFVQLAPVPPMDAERTALLVAVVREGLLNVEKHARAFSVVVSLGPCDGGVQVVVADDGTGEPAEPGASTGMGVRSLAERAVRAGGRVSLVRDEDGGCTLRAWLPDVEAR